MCFSDFYDIFLQNFNLSMLLDKLIPILLTLNMNIFYVYFLMNMHRVGRGYFGVFYIFGSLNFI